MMLRTIAALFVCACILPAQRKLQPEQLYERMICVVPMIGRGTFEDPRRPMFALNPNEKDKSKTDDEVTDKRSGIIGYGYQISDDGQYAIVEFVATDRAAFKEIQEASRSDVKKFHKGREKREDLVQELKRYKKDFDLDSLRVAVQ